ncbi:MAG TPA: M28 family peptidase [Candidatus Limnocylindria bacterium]|nr:M28 family peptidase [Candidatus Limnocylindria bacterium]
MRLLAASLALVLVLTGCGETTRLTSAGSPSASLTATAPAASSAAPAPTASPSQSQTPSPTIDPASCPRGVPCGAIDAYTRVINPYILDGHLGALTSFVSRDPRHPGHAKAKAYIKEQLGALGGGTISSQQTTYQGIPLENIFLTVDPPSPYTFVPQTGGAVLVSAHYDSTANRTSGWRPASDPAPGADDNATGTAGLLELARVVVTARNAGLLRTRVVLAFFDGEELTFKGSGAYMATLSKPYPYKAAINLDMVGFNPLADRLDLLWYTNASAGLRDRVIRANETYRIGVAPLNAQYAADGSTIMDAAPFGVAGIPSIALCQRYGENDATFPGNYTFHTVTDTPDKITNKRLWLKATRLTLATALELASETAP